MTRSVVFEATADHTLASSGCIAVIIWRQETTLAGIAASARLVASVARQHPRIGILTIIETQAAMPSSEARRGMAALMAQARNVVASGLAYEGEGLRSAAVRGVVTGLTMLARQPFPHKVFATVPLAAEWLVPQLVSSGVQISTSDLVDAVLAVRQRPQP